MSDINSNPESSVPSNDIQARREARRRKILENAKDRLEKLNERMLIDENKDGPTKITHRTFPDPEIETEELFGPKFPITTMTPQTFDAASIFNENSGGAEAELENIFQLFSQMNQLQSGSLAQQQQQQHRNIYTTPMIDEQNIQKQPESKLVRFFKTKVHLFIISCLTYILFSSEKEYFTKYSVFLPLLIWELTEAFLFKTNEKNTNVLFSIAFMMGGISPNISNGVLKIIGTLNKILKDVGVFIFFFVFCHILCTFHFTH